MQKKKAIFFSKNSKSGIIGKKHVVSHKNAVPKVINHEMKMNHGWQTKILSILKLTHIIVIKL